MPLSAACVKCHRKLKVRDELAGKKVRCPRCGWAVAIPGADEEAAAPERVPAERVAAAPVATDRVPAARIPAEPRIPAERVAAGRPSAERTTPAPKPKSKPKPQSDEPQWADEVFADLPVLERRSHTRGRLGRFFDATQEHGAKLARRWSAWVIIGIVVITLLVMQFGWDRITGATPTATQATAPTVAEKSDQPLGGTSKAAEAEKPADPAPVAVVEEAPANNSAPLARGKLAPKPEPAETPPSAKKKSTPTKKLPTENKSTVAARNFVADDSRADSDNSGPMHPGAGPPPPKGPNGDGPAAPVAHAPAGPTHVGAYNANNPPHTGEIVVVRLKDGLHVGKVTSVDVDKLQCEVTVLETAAYSKKAEIRETKRSETVRFGQIRVPRPPKRTPPK